ncbi:MAG: benzoyl-CoA reductase, bzd-type, subunit O [Dehalococcoidia bacterium]|nr:benzoyl-CoA reductase, bzd-type, subunit O [Dehalococcoidia bacterium]
MPEVKYQTRPIKLWQKAKELRANHYKEIMTARENGRLIVTGGTDGVSCLPAGLGDFVYLGGEPWGATIAMDPVLSTQCVEAVESKNFARDMCAYMRNYWGSMFINKSPFGGEFPKPDFCLQLGFCDSHHKWFQQVSEYFKVPYFAIDMPLGFFGEDNYDRRLEYLMGQLLDAIEWMEKVTGRKYDDSKLIDAVTYDIESSALWSQICCLNKAIPAPLDEKAMFSLYIIAVLIRHEKISRDFYLELKAEMEERVRDKIAAVPTETVRLMHDSQPPWYFLKLWRYLEEFGAVVVGSFYSFTLSGTLEKQPDGTWAAGKTPAERGITMKTREDAVRVLADWYLKKNVTHEFSLPWIKNNEMIEWAKEWSVDGFIIHLNRGCEGTAFGQMEARHQLLKSGIPVMTYEGNMADKREFNESQTLDRIDAFMESLGLKKG